MRTEEGKTQITLNFLPEPTASSRSLSGSVKIFFKKIRSQKLGHTCEYPILTAIEVNEQGDITYVTRIEEVKKRVANAQKIILCVHGIIGDSESMVRSVLKNYDLVLTFDYEGVYTSIKENARWLKQRLESVDLGACHGKELYIVAHSIGGLISRWFIEREGGNQIIKHLVMLGTPNAGSPWSWVQEITLSVARLLNEQVGEIAPPAKIVTKFLALAAEVLAKHMVEKLQKKNAVVFYDSNSDYSKSLKDEFKKALVQQRGQVLKEVKFSETNINGDNINQLIPLNTEVLVLFPSSKTLDGAIEVIKANGKKLPILGGDDMYTKKILNDGKENADGLTIAVPWHILSKPSSEFSITSRELWKGADVNWRTAMSYDATLALSEALRRNPTRQGVAEALRSSNFTVDGASGSIKFESGDRSQKYPQLVKIVANKESRSGLGYDFVPTEPLIFESSKGFVNLRQNPNTRPNQQVVKIPNNTTVTILNFKIGETEGCKKGWYKVQLQSQEGWMCSDYRQPKDE
ncbi:extracellular ligand-binding receptor [Calothrix sp. NIES-4071]|nr:extracellular ligand-binding receptor [Calothrix sp. NIES-4071]BAZ57164.1 extracellular ligand-binding receptor [Calothrix sp. NIES-4105]